ncbi:hypothetical protein [Aliidiomarina celeris]|uniref:hypothetical protein n=1 Tax=Aliidiomarina celeris TaxID=2249428 RepID=UPI000DEA1501|nr:hypothetical protein [Aliidiomarina celeris]
MNLDIVVSEVIHVVHIASDELEITAHRQSTENGTIEWELRIINSYGVAAVWTTTFSSSSEAIKAGVKAIQTEGVKAFTNAEHFEYLHSQHLNS